MRRLVAGARGRGAALPACDWPRTPAEARAAQEALRGRVSARDSPGPVLRVAGLDAHYAPKSGLTFAAAALVRLPDLVLERSALACRPTGFPYVPGLLSFREAPALLAALGVRPDLLLIDGQGLAHPRRFGLACHVGVLAGIPAIGVAKSRLVGSFAEPGPERGARSALLDRGEVIGAVLRTRPGVRPLFVSVGHRVSLESAVRLVLAVTGRYRLPEPCRLADRLSRAHGAH
ncbi:MAG: endonuclease V [Proteobacteria bacterium]|nr:endonuclease V [Pseudomonadota bacterium]